MPAPDPHPTSRALALPDYAGACIANVVPALLGRASDDDRGDPDWLPESVRHAQQVVLLVIDGLGWQQLRDRPGLAPTLSAAEGIDRPITSVAPTTTACALTSITTGCRPASTASSATGWPSKTRSSTSLRWTLGSGRVDRRPPYRPAHAFQPSRPSPVRRWRCRWCPRTSSAGPVSRPPTSATRRSRVPGALLLPVEVARLLGEGQRFVYAYYDGIDKVAHGSGLGALYDAELRAVDRLVADLVAELPSGAVLVVTADHGEIDVDQVELLGRDIMSMVTFMSGEGRFRWLHGRAGAAADLEAAAADLYGDTTWVMGRDQLIDRACSVVRCRTTCSDGWATWPCCRTPRSLSSTRRTPARTGCTAATAR